MRKALATAVTEAPPSVRALHAPSRHITQARLFAPSAPTWRRPTSACVQIYTTLLKMTALCKMLPKKINGLLSYRPRKLPDVKLKTTLNPSQIDSTWATKTVTVLINETDSSSPACCVCVFGLLRAEGTSGEAQFHKQLLVAQQKTDLL